MKRMKQLKGWLGAFSLVVLTLLAAGCGGGSGTTPAPAALSSVSSAPGNGQVTLNWTASGDAASYNIYYGTSAGVTTASPNKLTGVTSPKTVTGLSNGQAYYFVVTAVNAGGESAVSNEVTATPVAPPAKPSGIIVSGGDQKVTISWTASTGATSYNVYYAQATGVNTTNSTKVANVTSGSDIPNLTNGILYYFVVTAVNAGGESPVSSEKFATPAAALQAPGSPTHVAVTAGPGVGQASVSWDAVPNATTYKVYYLESGAAPTTATVLATPNPAVVPAPSPNTGTISTTVTGLTSGSTNYYFSVTAANSAGESAAQSNPKQLTTAVP